MRPSASFFLSISFILGGLMLFSSCQKQPLPAPERETEMPIYWDAYRAPAYGAEVSGQEAAQAGPATKLMVTSQSHFENLCAPSTMPGMGLKIGFWADYYRPLGGGEYEREANIFEDSYLVFKTEPNCHYNWHYEGEAQHWRLGGRYVIRAYFPHTMEDAIVKSATTANLFALEYNTHLVQEDLMVAYNKVHTADPVTGHPSIAYAYDPVTGFVPSQVQQTEPGGLEADIARGFTQPFSLHEAIPLNFRHTLAAIQLLFTFDHDEDDELLSVKFYNGPSQGFHTVGLLVFGDDSSTEVTKAPARGGGAATKAVPFLSPQEVQEVNAAKGDFHWVSYQSVVGNNPFYAWEIAGPRGIRFGRHSQVLPNGQVQSNELMAVAYSPIESRKLRISVDGVVTQGPGDLLEPGMPLGVVKDYPPYYNENYGWLFLIPQKVPDDVRMRFRTKKMGEVEVTMPAYVGTDQYGNLSPTGQWFCPGHSYAFTITLSRASAQVNVALSPWEERFASVDVDF